MKCEKKGEKNDFVIPLTTRFTLGWVSCFLGNIAAYEMWGGICLILHADLCFGITLEIVMLGFQAVALSHRPSFTSIKNILHSHSMCLLAREDFCVAVSIFIWFPSIKRLFLILIVFNWFLHAVKGAFTQVPYLYLYNYCMASDLLQIVNTFLLSGLSGNEQS